jgi:hypothetical protein
MREIACIEANIEPQVAAYDPAELLQPLLQGAQPGLLYDIALGVRHGHGESPHAAILLRACREWPRGRCGAA